MLREVNGVRLNVLDEGEGPPVFPTVEAAVGWAEDQPERAAS